MKLSWKRVFADPAVWLLLATNLVALYYYASHPAIFTTLIWLYWSQSVMYGIFAFTHLRMARKPVPKGYEGKIAGLMTKEEYANTPVWLYSRIFFFMHAIYIVFIVTMPKSGPFQWDFFWKVLGGFFLSQLVGFLQHAAQRKRGITDVEKQGGSVFVRVVPIHLCIIIQAFFTSSGLLVLFILKVITDMAAYLHTTSYYRKDDVVNSVTAVNLDSNTDNLL